ncbi:MAG: GNAT family N-acetyltransferase [Candidatus Riflebacteria bacterium HGW-Riflebacteria-1]|jgi:GNAT superfamily N-acetyltransferase|nr:MAG: GNAT family N-acetyltransferase [Candidatus Riflebacteria bacterium HGW-Riflebacteria-1]
MLKIINVHEFAKSIDTAIEYIHGIWGNSKSFAYYQDAIRHSFTNSQLPQFYLLLHAGEPVGCAALITNDFISRHDLYPWVACLYVAEEFRGKAYGSRLLTHAVQQARAAGFSAAYLTTDHDGYYEKYGWQRIEDGIDLFTGLASRIYKMNL